ncbi:MAG: hypothetical protein IPO21_18750 [Bacteroidales bacterium]|nr:hypothetical protein [Bacteroidales bacterium]
MKKLEIILSILFLIGFIMKTLMLPGGSIIVISTSLILSFVYFLSFAFFNDIELKNIFKKDAYAHTTVKRIIGSEILGYGLAVTVMGIYSKLQFYLVANQLLSNGLTVVYISMIIILIYHFRNKRKDWFYKRILIRTSIILVIGTLLLITPFETLLDIYCWTNPEKAVLTKVHL